MKFCKIHLFLTGLFLLLMVSIYWIPEQQIFQNLIISSDLSSADSMTAEESALLFSISKNPELSSVFNALQNSSLWNGVFVILRPLFYFFHLIQIRHIWGVLFFLLTFELVRRIDKKIGHIPALLYLFTFLWSDIRIVSKSPVYMGSYLLLFLSSLFLLHQKKAFFTDRKLLTEFFYIIGAATAFLDSAMLPSLTLSLLLIFVILLSYQKTSVVIITQNIGFSCLAWLGGYLFMTCTKWLLALLFTGRNLLPDILTDFRQYTFLSSDSPIHFMRNSIEAYISPVGFGIPFFVKCFLILLVIYLILVIKGHRSLPEIVALLPLFIPAVIPVLTLLLLPGYGQDNLQYSAHCLFPSAYCVLLFLANTIHFNAFRRSYE